MGDDATARPAPKGIGVSRAGLVRRMVDFHSQLHGSANPPAESDARLIQMTYEHLRTNGLSAHLGLATGNEGMGHAMQKIIEYLVANPADTGVYLAMREFGSFDALKLDSAIAELVKLQALTFHRLDGKRNSDMFANRFAYLATLIGFVKK